MGTRIKYLDEEKMEISFSSFVFNVRSINKKFGSLAAFVEEYELWGVTNGRLFCLSGKLKPTLDLYEKFQRDFLPLNLQKGEDFIYVFKHPLSDVILPHPASGIIPWLGSEINEEGNFVWFRVSHRFPDAVSSFPERIDTLPPEQELSFKLLDAMDPDPGLPPELYKKVRYDEFIAYQNNCFPLFIETRLGIFPEEIILESLEGQIIALMGESMLEGSTTFVQIINGKRKEIKRFSRNTS